MFKHSKSCVASVFMALTVLMTHADFVSAQVTLERKYAEGSTSKSQIESSVNQTLTLNGADIVTKSSSFIVTSTEVGKRGPDGSLSITDKVQSMQSELDLQGIKLEFDSANPEKKAPLPQLEPMMDLYRSVVKLPTIRTLAAKTNKLVSVALPEGEFEKLPDVAKERFEAAKMKKAIEQSEGYLPEGQVKVGDKWERSFDLDLGSGQVMAFRVNFEYVGTTQHDGATLDKIEGKPFEVSFSISNNPALQLTKSDLKIKSASMTYLFDREKGELVSKTSKMQIDGPLTLVIGGMALDGKVDLSMEEKHAKQK